MKSPFFKSLLVAGALLLAWNCTDDTTIPTNLGPLSDKAESVWVINIGENNNLYIAEDGTVYDTQWNVFGTFSEGNIVTSENEIFMVGVDTTNRPMAKVIVAADGTKMVEFDDGTVTDTEGNEIGTVDDSGNIINENGEVIAESPTKPTVTSSASGTNPTSAGTNPGTNPGGNSAASTSSNSSGTHNTPTSSAAAQQSGQCNGQCYDAPSGKCVDYYKEQVGPNGEKYAYNNSCELNCYWDPKNNGCKGMSGSTTPASSGSQQPKSSSSKQQTQSSSSKNQTQSSASQQSGGCPNIEYVNNGHSGSGYATRYWDGCKPSCSWRENASKNGGIGTPAKQCNANGKTQNTDYDARSVCEGGPAATCTSQVPFTISGCDKIGFAFAAVPAADGAACGKCFELSFTGEGNWETKANHQALKGKKLIVMVSNVGWDVSGGQFDVMIPGGGVGIYDGTQGYGWGDIGAKSGGLLSDCENSVGWDGDLLTKRKNCLVQKCNSAFANDSEAKSGCLFLANFMEAAGNPKHTYKEVKCPSVLSSKY